MIPNLPLYRSILPFTPLLSIFSYPIRPYLIFFSPSRLSYTTPTYLPLLTTSTSYPLCYLLHLTLLSPLSLLSHASPFPIFLSFPILSDPILSSSLHPIFPLLTLLPQLNSPPIASNPLLSLPTLVHPPLLYHLYLPSSPLRLYFLSLMLPTSPYSAITTFSLDSYFFFLCH